MACRYIWTMAEIRLDVLSWLTLLTHCRVGMLGLVCWVGVCVCALGVCGRVGRVCTLSVLWVCALWV